MIIKIILIGFISLTSEGKVSSTTQYKTEYKNNIWKVEVV